jgi:F-box-like
MRGPIDPESRNYTVTEIPTMAFNVEHLLNTNSTPSQEQRNNLQNFILQLDEAILHTDEIVNEQILAIQAKILVLQTSRTQLVQQRRCYSSLLSPVRCLPTEIFGEIFVYATRDRPRHVLNLSAVCRLWRCSSWYTQVVVDIRAWPSYDNMQHAQPH